MKSSKAEAFSTESCYAEQKGFEIGRKDKIDPLMLTLQGNIIWTIFLLQTDAISQGMYVC